MLLPMVSVIIATFNSEKVLCKTLEAIKKQSYPRERLEILIIDGGSTDNTLNLASQYHCKIIPNPKTDPVNAKMIGIRSASGKYVITVDHDEVMINRESIALKVQVLEENPQCRAVFCSGYKKPVGYPKLNQYISEFGDPFSMFVYRFSKDHQFYNHALSKSFSIDKVNDKYVIYALADIKKAIIIELCCMGTMVNKEYFEKIPHAFDEGAIFTHLFYLMVQKGNNQVAITKDDPLEHYSVDSWSAYLPKIKWRIINNIHFSKQGDNGFSGREKYQSAVRYKKYIFPLYTFTFIFSIWDSCYLAVTRKNPIYLLHWVLCLYVSVYIIYQYILKMLNRKPHFTSYDGKKILDK